MLCNLNTTKVYSLVCQFRGMLHQNRKLYTLIITLDYACTTGDKYKVWESDN